MTLLSRLKSRTRGIRNTKMSSGRRISPRKTIPRKNYTEDDDWDEDEEAMVIDTTKPRNSSKKKTSSEDIHAATISIEDDTKDQDRPEATVSSAEVSNNDYEDDPLGLKEEANEWLLEQLVPGNETTVRHQLHILPRKGGEIPTKAYQDAMSEYFRRLVIHEKTCSAQPIQPVLVALGVNRTTMKGFLNDYRLPRNAQYLYFPTLQSNGLYDGALFMSYYRGREHLDVSNKISSYANCWVAGYSDYIKSSFNSGVVTTMQNSQDRPDFRILPRRANRDHEGGDVDPLYDDHRPHTRFYFEMNYRNQNIVPLRMQGLKLMKPEYTRVFLGGYVHIVNETKLEYEMALVLWRKKTNGSIVVKDAVSFGTVDLGRHTIEKFNTDMENSLPPVTKWRRPTDVDDLTPNRVSNPSSYPKEWTLNVKFRDIFYKVSSSSSGDSKGPEYVTAKKSIQKEDLEIGLWKMSSCFYTNYLEGKRSMPKPFETLVQEGELSSSSSTNSSDEDDKEENEAKANHHGNKEEAAAAAAAAADSGVNDDEEDFQNSDLEDYKNSNTSTAAAASTTITPSPKPSISRENEEVFSSEDSEDDEFVPATITRTTDATRNEKPSKSKIVFTVDDKDDDSDDVTVYILSSDNEEDGSDTATAKAAAAVASKKVQTSPKKSQKTTTTTKSDDDSFKVQSSEDDSDEECFYKTSVFDSKRKPRKENPDNETSNPLKKKKTKKAPSTAPVVTPLVATKRSAIEASSSEDELPLAKPKKKARRKFLTSSPPKAKKRNRGSSLSPSRKKIRKQFGVGKYSV